MACAKVRSKNARLRLPCYSCGGGGGILHRPLRHVAALFQPDRYLLSSADSIIPVIRVGAPRRTAIIDDV